VTTDYQPYDSFVRLDKVFKPKFTNHEADTPTLDHARTGKLLTKGAIGRLI